MDWKATQQFQHSVEKVVCATSSLRKVPSFDRKTPAEGLSAINLVRPAGIALFNFYLISSTNSSACSFWLVCTIMLMSKTIILSEFVKTFLSLQEKFHKFQVFAQKETRSDERLSCEIKTLGKIFCLRGVRIFSFNEAEVPCFDKDKELLLLPLGLFFF